MVLVVEYSRRTFLNWEWGEPVWRAAGDQSMFQRCADQVWDGSIARITLDLPDGEVVTFERREG